MRAVTSSVVVLRAIDHQSLCFTSGRIVSSSSENRTEMNLDLGHVPLSTLRQFHTDSSSHRKILFRIILRTNPALCQLHVNPRRGRRD